MNTTQFNTHFAAEALAIQHFVAAEHFAATDLAVRRILNGAIRMEAELEAFLDNDKNGNMSFWFW